MTLSKSWEKLISIVNQGTISTRNPRERESLKGLARPGSETPLVFQKYQIFLIRIAINEIDDKP